MPDLTFYDEPKGSPGPQSQLSFRAASGGWGTTRPCRPKPIKNRASQSKKTRIITNAGLVEESRLAVRQTMKKTIWVVRDLTDVTSGNVASPTHSSSFAHRCRDNH